MTANLSFRGRLLLLLVAVSLIQAAVAAFTYNSLQTKPLHDRIEAQLSASVRAAAPMIDARLRNAGDELRTLAANHELITAIETGDRATAESILASSIDASSLEQGSSAVSESIARPYVTGPGGEVVIGKRIDAPSIERDDVTNVQIRKGVQFIGTLHVPVVLDQSFMKSLARYSGTDVAPFAVDERRLATGSSVEEAPTGVHRGLQRVRFAGKDQYALFEPVLDSGVYIGAAIPRSSVTRLEHSGRTRLLVFVGMLMLLMLIVSWLITQAVSVALRRFAFVTRQLADGELDYRIPVVGADEIALLALSFNEMAENLETRMRHLTDARARMRRQVEVFGEALANTNEIGDMLAAVCAIAVESTGAAHARFWTIDEEGFFRHAANIGLRPADTQPCELETEVLRRGTPIATSHDPYWLVVPVRSSEGVLGMMTLVSRDTEFTADDVRVVQRLGVQAAFAIDNAAMHEQLREQATRDGLTGLDNHRTMQEKLSQQLEKSYDSNMPLGVVLLDVDNFKQINDTYGHQTGDEALRAIANVLMHRVAGAGIAARYGGEEFVVVLPGCDAGASSRIADHIREEIAEVEIPVDGGGYLCVTTSIGVSNTDQYPHVVPKDVLLKHADAALYQAKRAGKNRVVTAGPDSFDSRSMPEAA